MPRAISKPALFKRLWGGVALHQLCAIALGACLTLAVRGYQFGRSNHDVYLLDAVRRLHPEVLAHDWFTTHTLQYHALFGLLTTALMRVHEAPAGFLAGYLALVLGLHVAWLAMTRTLGGSTGSYLLAVVLFYLSAGGTGLGMYQFLQDAAFLPSNIAAVALLGGLACWMARRPLASAGCLAVAGAMHLNYAVVIPPLWIVLVTWNGWRAAQGREMPLWRSSGKSVGAEETLPSECKRGNGYLLLACVLVLLPCLLNIAFALRAVAAGGTGLSLQEFVDLYVRLRHPHHYNPRAWPGVLWVCFLWPIPLICVALRRRAMGSDAWRQFRRIYLLLALFITTALLLAGVWYVSETLIQMSLYRFTPHLLLLGCVAAAMVLQRYPRQSIGGLFMVAGGLGLVERLAPGDALDPFRSPLLLIACLISLIATFNIGLILAGTDRPVSRSDLSNSLVLRLVAPLLLSAIAVAAVTVAWRHERLGINIIPADPPAYLAVCRWARANTPTDAVFLVPPGEQSFRLHARRAIVVNFKGVPQLSANLPEWRDRLRDILELDSLMSLPHPFAATLAACNERYESRSAGHLLEVARRYHARYLLLAHRLARAGGQGEGPRLAYTDETGRYFLYDLAP
jgi:hypothetical protein